MTRENMKLVIVGHVDHGKSTLIGRLLYDTGSLPEGKMDEIRNICESLGKELEFAYVMDNLEEEQNQGITIDATQICFKSALKDYVIIDAPGHVEFLKSMITGASRADMAILIVDAAEGVKEQTKRHAYILQLIGIGAVLVAINKMDLVNYDKSRFEQISGELSGFLGVLGIKPLQTLPVSAKHGDNIYRASIRMPWYTGPTLVSAFDCLPPVHASNDGALRVAIQDVYNFERRIYVGRVESGTLRVGDEIVVLPSGEITRIHSLEEYGKHPQKAESGKVIGLTIDDKLFVNRGYVLARRTDLPIITDVIEASIFWMDRLAGKQDEMYTLRCATQEVPCKIESIHKTINTSTLEINDYDPAEIKYREVAEVILRTGRPIVVDEFNKVRELARFVLARENPVAGGRVEKANPSSSSRVIL